MREHQQIRPLTGLRGIAALYVLTYHYFPLTGSAAPPTGALRFLGHGYLAVDAFFVLSGFVMAMTYARDFANGFSGRAYRRFLGRRIARIYPLYCSAALTGLALVAAHRLPYEHTVPRAVAVTANLLMVQAWGIAPSFDSPAWSLSAEWAAYLVFPALLLPASFPSARVHAITALTCCGVIIALGSLPVSLLPDYLRRDPLNFNGYWLGLPLVRCIPEFTLGMLAFGAARTEFGRTIARSRWAAALLCAALAALLTAARTDVAIVLLLPLLIVSLTSEGHVPGKLLASPVLQLAGTLSFSIYLIHKLLIGVVQWLATAGRAAGVPHAHIGAALLCFALTIGLACAAYRWIEVPGRNLLRARFEPATPLPAAQPVGEVRPPVAAQT